LSLQKGNIEDINISLLPCRLPSLPHFTNSKHPLSKISYDSQQRLSNIHYSETEFHDAYNTLRAGIQHIRT